MDVTTVDIGFPQPSAVHILKHETSAAMTATIIGAGTPKGLPRVLRALEGAGIKPGAVERVVLTDLALTHASGAADLASACPNAALVVHPAAKAEIADENGALMARGRAMFGESFEPVFGKVAPVDSSRVIVAEDGESVPGTSLQYLHLPAGLFVLEHQHRSAFVGNSLGAAYPSATGATGGRLIVPALPDLRFCPDDAVEAADRVVNSGALRAFTTHYGLLTDLDGAAAQVRRAVRVFESVAVQALRMHMRGAMLREFCHEQLVKHLKDEANSAALPWSEELEDLLEIDIGIVREATARLVEGAVKQGMRDLGNDANFHSEHEGGRLRSDKLTAEHIEMLVRSWNGTDKKERRKELSKWDPHVDAAEASIPVM